MKQPGAWARAIALTGAFALALGATSISLGAPSPLGHTTLEERIVPDGAPGFDQLGTGPGEPYTIREDGFGAAQPGREPNTRTAGMIVTTTYRRFIVGLHLV